MKRVFFIFTLVFLATSIAPSAQAEEAVRVEVVAFVDSNGDKLMSRGEGLENAAVILTVGDHSQVKMLEAGKVTFSLPYADVEEVRVEIPYLAVGEETKPRDGVAQVKFRLTAPELPVYLP